MFQGSLINIVIYPNVFHFTHPAFQAEYFFFSNKKERRGHIKFPLELGQ